MELWGRLNMHRHAYSLYDKLGFWGWLKRPLKPTHTTNPIVLRGDLAESDGDVVLSTTLLSEKKCKQALE